MLSGKRSYRCGYCNVNWPLRERYHRCPVCTTVLVDHKAKPISESEALKRLALLNRTAKYSFHNIIVGGGFTDDEMAEVMELEARLTKR